MDGSLDFRMLRRAYASGLSPQEVIGAVYDRISRRGDDRVWIHLVPREEALRRCDALLATRAEQQLLWGLPCAIKDNINVPGLPSTSAFPPSRRVAEKTGPAVQRLIDAGAVVIGKTNMDQLAVGLVGVRSPYGVARNAFDARYVPGGSSSGSAVAVAGGLVSFALGNDAAGSGRVPAAFGNIVGIKPTPGLVSNTAVVGGGTAKSLETISVFALTVDDGMDVLRLIAGYDPDDLFSKREASYCDLRPRPAPESFRFGVPDAGHLDFCGDADAAKLFDDTLTRLEELGGRSVEIDFTPFAVAQRLLYEGPFLAERNASVLPLISGSEHALHPTTREILRSGVSWKATDVYQAIHQLAELKRQARRIFQRIDVMVVPTTPTIFTIEQVEADPIGLNARLGIYTNFVNLMELSAVAVPSGFRTDGLPLGVTLIGAPFEDGRLAPIAASLHRRTGVRLGATPCTYPS
jgi:allophanate hydrolase